LKKERGGRRREGKEEKEKEDEPSLHILRGFTAG
jgi:hypothetical protein